MTLYNKKKITHLDYELLKEKYDEKELERVLAKIDDDYPVQYAIGFVDFLGFKIAVDERVLIPRFETELLVDKLARLMNKYGLTTGNIVDLCTGSGCIAISLAHKFPTMHITAIDISKDALDVAHQNAKNNNVSIDFQEMDIIKNIKLNKKYDVLVSNPPYVKANSEVSPNIRFEPNIALYPGDDELIFYKTILQEASSFLNDKNILAFEISSSMGKKVCAIAKKHFPQAQILLEQDYQGRDRFVFIINA